MDGLALKPEGFVGKKEHIKSLVFPKREQKKKVLAAMKALGQAHQHMASQLDVQAIK